jgi:hypothetical protein
MASPFQKWTRPDWLLKGVEGKNKPRKNVANDVPQLGDHTQ